MTNQNSSFLLPESLLRDLSEKSWCLWDQAFPPTLCEELVADLESLQQKGLLKKAAIGRGQKTQVRQEIRGDWTSWLEDGGRTAPQQEFFRRMQELRQNLNENFFMNLKDLEAHYALYPPGEGYQKHLDQHAGTSSRKITFILYLNKNWKKNQGGELILYKPEEDSQILHEIEPLFARLVLFRSEVFPHQVAPCLSPRKSLTGWFRTTH